MNHQNYKNEYNVHKAVVQYIRANEIKYPSLKLWFHPANGEKRDIKTGIKLNNMGVNPGVPDLIHPKGYAIELKKEGKGEESLSPDQEFWRLQLLALGYQYLCSSDPVEIKNWIKERFIGSKKDLC